MMKFQKTSVIDIEKSQSSNGSSSGSNSSDFDQSCSISIENISSKIKEKDSTEVQLDSILSKGTPIMEKEFKHVTFQNDLKSIESIGIGEEEEKT